MHPDRFAFSVTEDFNFVVFIAAPNEASDFRRPDVEADHNLFFRVRLRIHGVGVSNNNVVQRLDLGKSNRCACMR